MHIETADLCDHYPERVQVLAPVFVDYGGNSRFHGPVRCVRVDCDFVLVRANWLDHDLIGHRSYTMHTLGDLLGSEFLRIRGDVPHQRDHAFPARGPG